MREVCEIPRHRPQIGVASKGVRAHLLQFAKEVARREQIKLLCVDCWMAMGGLAIVTNFLLSNLPLGITKGTALETDFFSAQIGREWTGGYRSVSDVPVFISLQYSNT